VRIISTEDTLLPKHDDFSLLRRAFAATAIVAATALLVWNTYRITVNPVSLEWWVVPVAVAAMVAVDFLSGMAIPVFFFQEKGRTADRRQVSNWTGPLRCPF
jgi:hypothetical protein